MAIIKYTEQIVLTTCLCSECGITYAMPEDFREKLRENHRTFYCPNGHTHWFPQDNETEKLRKELKRKEQELANEVQRKLMMQQDFENEIKSKDKKLKRLTNGVCPCCNRSFHNLQQHMKKQHPEQVSKSR